MFRSNVILCVMGLFLSTLSFAEELIALKINQDKLHLLPEGGLDAIGGVDDWLLSNENLRGFFWKRAPNLPFYVRWCFG